ncbi:hypothetical protein TNCT_285171, partial [Trichonephila clavata]
DRQRHGVDTERTNGSGAFSQKGQKLCCSLFPGKRTILAIISLRRNSDRSDHEKEEKKNVLYRQEGILLISGVNRLKDLQRMRRIRFWKFLLKREVEKISLISFKSDKRFLFWKVNYEHAGVIASQCGDAPFWRVITIEILKGHLEKPDSERTPLVRESGP